MANTLKSPFKNRLSFNNGTSSDEKDTDAAMGENNTPIVALESSGDDGVVDAMSETNGTSARTDSPSSADSMSGVEEDSDVHDLSRNENSATTTEDGGELLVAEGRNEIMMDRSLHTISDEGAMGDDSGEGNAANSDDGVTASEEMKISNKDNLDVSSESMNKSSSSNNNNILPDNSCPKWSKVLSTPSDCAPFTPAVDMSSWKENLHGLGKSPFFLQENK